MAVARSRNRKRLGELLVDAGLLSTEQLEEALTYQKQTGDRLGKILTDREYLSEEQLVEVLEYQLGIPRVDLARTLIGPDVVNLVPAQLARRHLVMPISRTDGRLRLAVADPFNIVAIDDVRDVAGLEIELAITTERDIKEAIDRCYGVRGAVEDVIQTIEETDDQGEDETVDRLRRAGDEAPIVRLVNLIISQGVRERASDIHIEPSEKDVRIRYRVDGFLREVMRSPKRTQAALVSRIKVLARMDIAERRVPQDGQIKITVDNTEVELRISTMPTQFGEKVVLRILNKNAFLLQVDQLGFGQLNQERFLSALKRPHGMVLVTGPTGSGKTTTLYAALGLLNRVDRNITTVEDPIEYTLPGINQTQVNPKAGLTFARALRSIVRQDPDVIMVGEIRDSETAQIAVQSALTGHLVLSTLHTNDAAGTLARLVDMGIEPFLVASSVVCVVAQRLVRMVCPACREEYRVPAREIAAGHLKELFAGREDELVTLYRGKGCPRCEQSGYYGRLAIQEVMPMTLQMRQLVTQNAPADSLRAQAVADGMVTLKHDGVAKALRGLTTIEEVLRVAFTED
ncbi:MAG: type II secretion system ATPase GspE [Chitinophagales bacterium]